MAKHARQCQRCSVHIKRGKEHYAWKGDDALATTKRERIQKRLALGGVTCERCKEAPAVDRHHIDGDPGNNVRSNLALLCRRCHMAVDGRLEKLRTRERLYGVGRS